MNYGNQKYVNECSLGCRCKALKSLVKIREMHAFFCLKICYIFWLTKKKIFKKPAFHFSAFRALAWHHIRVVVFELYVPLTFFYPSS